MNNRADRIRKTLMKEISDIIFKNVKDPRICGIVSITDIELSQDYSVANVYVSVYGSKTEVPQTMEALVDNAPKIRHEVGKRIRLRHTPELRFHHDNSLERGSKISQLIDKISKGEI